MGMAALEKCKFCGVLTPRIDIHYSRNPPAGCPDVAVALDADYWPFKVDNDGRGKGSAGRACATPGCAEPRTPTSAYCYAHRAAKARVWYARKAEKYRENARRCRARKAGTPAVGRGGR